MGTGLHEHEAFNAIPNVVGIAGVEIVSERAIHGEDQRRVAGWLDGFHGDLEPIRGGLGKILQSELWAHFGRAELEAELSRASADVFMACLPREAEMGNRCHHQIDLRFLISCLEGG
jgi:hypothetical protein